MSEARSTMLKPRHESGLAAGIANWSLGLTTEMRRDSSELQQAATVVDCIATCWDGDLQGQFQQLTCCLNYDWGLCVQGLVGCAGSPSL